MAVFQAALVNELEKLYKRKKILLAVLLSIGIIVLGQLAIIVVRSRFGVATTGSGEFPLLVLSVVVNTILPLFTALVAIDSFSGEFANNWMRITLTRPVSRFKIFSAKITAIAVFILANLLLMLVFSLLAGSMFNGNPAGLGSIGGVVLSYLVTILPMIVLALGIVLLANIFKSGVSVFFACILGFIILKVLGIFFTQYAGIFITSLLDWYNLWLANSLPLGKLLRQLLLMLSYSVMLFTAGFYLFDKKEL